MSIVFVAKRTHTTKLLLRLLKNAEGHAKGDVPVEPLAVGEAGIVFDRLVLAVDLSVHPPFCLENISLLSLCVGVVHHEHALNFQAHWIVKGKTQQVVVKPFFKILTGTTLPRGTFALFGQVFF